MSLAIRDQEVVRGSWVSQPQPWTGLLGPLTWLGLLGSVLRDLPPASRCPAPGVLGMPNSQLGKGKGQAPDVKLRSRCPGVHSPCKRRRWALSAGRSWLPTPPGPAREESTGFKAGWGGMGLIFFSITIYSYKKGVGKKDAADFVHEPHLSSETAGESGLGKKAAPVEAGEWPPLPSGWKQDGAGGSLGQTLPCPWRTCSSHCPRHTLLPSQEGVLL